MIFHKGLWIPIDLDGIVGVIGKTLSDEAFLIVTGPERTPGDVYSRYHSLGPEGLPKEDDKSVFACLYRKLDSLVQSEKIRGPYGENHPAVYARFQYFHSGSLVGFLAMLDESGIVIRVRKLPHSGDDAEFEQARKDLNRWIDTNTTFDPNPKIEEARKQEDERKERKARMERAERLDRKFRWFVLFPILLVILTGILWGAFTLHWTVGIVASLFFGFVWWWTRH